MRMKLTQASFQASRRKQAGYIRHRVSVALWKRLEGLPEAIQRDVGAADQSSHSGLEYPAAVLFLSHWISLMRHFGHSVNHTRFSFQAGARGARGRILLQN